MKNGWQKRHPHHDLSGGGLDLTLIQGQDQDQGQGQDHLLATCCSALRCRHFWSWPLVLALTLDQGQVQPPPRGYDRMSFLPTIPLGKARGGLEGLKLDETDAANSFLRLPMARNSPKLPLRDQSGSVENH